MRGTAYRGSPALAPPLREDHLLTSSFGAQITVPVSLLCPSPAGPPRLGGAPRGRVVARQPKMSGCPHLMGGLGLQGRLPGSGTLPRPPAARSAVLLLGLND